MVGHTTAQDTNIEGTSRGDLRIIQVRHRDTSDSPNPDAILFIQRTEHIIGEGARLTLQVKRVDSERPYGNNQFSWAACYVPAGCGNPERVKLTDVECRSGGDLRMRLSGLLGYRIGTYLMSDIVSWAKQWPTAEVMQIKLSWEDEKPSAWDGMNKTRRNRFYEQFGVEFIHSETESQITACSKYMLAENLTTEDAERAWRMNIRETNVYDWLVDQQLKQEDQDRQLAKLKRKAAFIQQRHDLIEARPFRYAAHRLVTNPIVWISLAVVAAAFPLAKGVIS